MAATIEGKMLGHCRVERLLGEGGMAKVYLGHHETLDKKVAVKVLAPQLAADKEFVARFLREARLAAKLDHPNIVQVLDAGSAGEMHYMVMQFIEGTDLHSYLKKQTKLSVKDVVSIGKRVAAALAAAHERGLIHRDIKPSNLMIGKGGKIYVTDFGLARDVSANMELTRTDTVMGSPHYMSPEQAMGEKLDGRTDVYSLGASLYHMLAGRTPYEGPTPAAIMLKHAQSDVTPEPLRKVNPEVPSDLEALIMKMMAKKREDRVPSMKAVVEAFERMRTADQGPTVVAATPVTPKLRRRYMLMGAGLAIGVLIVIGILTGGDKTPPTDAMIAEAQKLEAAGDLAGAIAKYGEVVKAAPGSTAATMAQTRITELEERLKTQQGEARLAAALKNFVDGKALFPATLAELQKIQKEFEGGLTGEKAEDAVADLHRKQVGRRAEKLVAAIEAHKYVDMVAYVDPEVVKKSGPEEVGKILMVAIVGLQLVEKAAITKAEADLGRLVVRPLEKTASIPMRITFKSGKITELPLDWFLLPDDWYAGVPKQPSKAPGEALMAEAQKLEQEAGADVAKIEAAIAKYRDVVHAAPNTPFATAAAQRISELDGKLKHHAADARMEAALKNFKDGRATFAATRAALEKIFAETKGTSLETRVQTAIDQMHKIQLVRRATIQAAAIEKREWDKVVDLVDPRAVKQVGRDEMRKGISGRLTGEPRVQITRAQIVEDAIAPKLDRGMAFVPLKLTIKPRFMGPVETKEVPFEWTLLADDWYLKPGSAEDRPSRKP